MNDSLYNFTDTKVDLEQAGSYTLLLQINTAVFSYAIVQNNKLLAWGADIEIDELINPVEFNELLSAPFKQVIIGLKPLAYTLVPEKIFNDKHINDFARFLDVQPGESVFVQQLDTENRVIYKVDAASVTAAEKHGLENTVFGLKGWVKAVAGSNPGDDTLYMDINGNSVSVLYYNYGKLRFLNSFEFYTPDELAYYAAYVAEQLKMQPKKMQVCLSGNVKDDDNAARLADFFDEADTTNLYILQTDMKAPPHSILALAALILCG